MSGGCKQFALDGGVEDMLCGLPLHVLDKIFECLPIKDAARTSILSRKWRYLWSASPCLVFNKKFFKTLKTANTSKLLYKYVNVIHKILLAHQGSVLNFSLYIPHFAFHWDENIDKWLLFLSRNGIEQLYLDYHRSYKRYQLPSYVFSCPKLTIVRLKNIIFKPPAGFSGFANLVHVEFEGIEFAACTLNGVSPVAPLVSILKFKSCIGVENFNILAPHLLDIVVHYTRDVKPVLFDNFPNLISLDLIIGKEWEVFYRDKSGPINLHVLHQKYPRIKRLWLDGCYLKLVAAATFERRSSFAFQYLKKLVFLQLSFNDLDQITCAIWLLNNSPKLRTVQILMPSSKGTAVESLLTRLKAPDCMGEMWHLRSVVFDSVEGSEVELLLIKSILAHSPKLESLCVKFGVADVPHQLRISIALLGYCRASKKANIIYEG